MKPEKKAKELVEKFGALKMELWDDGGGGYYYENITAELAEQCAIIVVQEILNEFPQGYKGNFEEKRKAYWQSVKQLVNQISQ